MWGQFFWLFFFSSSSGFAGFVGRFQHNFSGNLNFALPWILRGIKKALKCIHRFEWIAQWWCLQCDTHLSPQCPSPEDKKKPWSIRMQRIAHRKSTIWKRFQVLDMDSESCSLATFFFFFLNTIECSCLCVYMQISSSVFERAPRTWLVFVFGFVKGSWKNGQR